MPDGDSIGDVIYFSGARVHKLIQHLKPKNGKAFMIDELSTLVIDLVDTKVKECFENAMMNYMLFPLGRARRAPIIKGVDKVEMNNYRSLNKVNPKALMEVSCHYSITNVS